MLKGPYIDGSAVIIGGLAGAFLSKKIPKRVRSGLPLTLGLCSVCMGVVLIVEVKILPSWCCQL